ncbi:MAG: GntR family transcriptional regulator [Lachnospiraceae bacterium]|nr:GntR family transcriptional regulator [Lachnospiraceae bacterium]
MSKTSPLHDSLVDKAYESIRKDLTCGELKPGQKITFQELVKKYEISETPIKQALNRMVVEGLVESIPRKGMRIKPISIQEYNEILDIRYILESYFAPYIMEAVSYHPEYISELRANIQKQYRAIEIGTTEPNDFLEIYSIDHEFHRLLLKYCNHKRALQIYEMVGAHSFSYFLYNKKPKSKLIAGVQEHQVIVDALENQDLDALKAAIELHITGARMSINYTLDI